MEFKKIDRVLTIIAIIAIYVIAIALAFWGVPIINEASRVTEGTII